MSPIVPPPTTSAERSGSGRSRCIPRRAHATGSTIDAQLERVARAEAVRVRPPAGTSRPRRRRRCRRSRPSAGTVALAAAAAFAAPQCSEGSTPTTSPAPVAPPAAADGDDLAPGLVARDQRVAGGRQALVEDVPVGAADAAAADGHDDLVASGRGVGDGLDRPARRAPSAGPPARPHQIDQPPSTTSSAPVMKPPPRRPGSAPRSRSRGLAEAALGRHLGEGADHLVADDPLDCSVRNIPGLSVLTVTP